MRLWPQATSRPCVLVKWAYVCGYRRHQAARWHLLMDYCNMATWNDVIISDARPSTVCPRAISLSMSNKQPANGRQPCDMCLIMRTAVKLLTPFVPLILMHSVRGYHTAGRSCMVNQPVNSKNPAAHTAFPFNNAWHTQGADAASPLVERLMCRSYPRATDGWEGLWHCTPGPDWHCINRTLAVLSHQ